MDERHAALHLPSVFPLFSKTAPQSADDLRERMNAGLERAFVLARPPVSIDAPDFPAIDELTISLDNARLRDDAPRAVFETRSRGQKLPVAKFSMTGNRVAVRGAAVDVSVDATDLRLIEGTTADGDIVLLFEGAAAGRVQVAASKAAIESLIATVAKQEAGAHGVTIDDVKLHLQQRGPRSIAAEVQLRARKLFVGASIRITAQLDLDSALTAKISGLRCSGDGPIGSFACGVLSPHLQRLDGREFPLMALPLGDIRLRDVHLAVGDQVAVTAEFAAA